MDTQERLEILKDAREKISNEIEELKNEIKNEKPKCWKPVNGKKIWEWSYMFNVPMTQVYSSGCDIQNNKYAEGELFPTEELCEERHNEKIYKERWKRLSIESGEDENPLDGVHEHWYVYYDVSHKRLSIDAICYMKSADICFPSYEDAKDAIKEIGEENVKRYILGVKE